MVYNLIKLTFEILTFLNSKRSFGILLSEIFNFGAIPYSGMSNGQVKIALSNKEMPELPNECPIQMYKLKF